MRLVIESPDEEGKEAYYRTVSTILSESTVRGSIREFYIYADPKEPLVILAITFSKSGEVLKFSDVVTLKAAKEGVIAVCENDKLMPEVLRILWEKVGSDKVEQLSRYEVMVKENLSEEILNAVVYDPSKELMTGLIDIIVRTIPEGFRIRKYMQVEGKIVIVASEDLIKEEWIKMAEKILRGDYVRTADF
ncbi:MAG: methanogenesis marker 17 protein [Archaeoglobales archaeon]|nr:methanogenesis marker 17 protein [Archaeoglobales archaeon]